MKQYIARFLSLETYEPEECLHYILSKKKALPPGSEPSPSREVEAEANQEAYSDKDSDEDLDIQLVSVSEIV